MDCAVNFVYFLLILCFFFVLIFFFICVGFWVHFGFLCSGLYGVLKFLCIILVWAMMKKRRETVNMQGKSEWFVG